MALIEHMMGNSFVDPWIDISTPSGFVGTFQSKAGLGRAFPICWVDSNRYAVLNRALSNDDLNARFIDVNESTGAITVQSSNDVGTVANTDPPQNVSGGALIKLSSSKLAFIVRRPSSPYNTMTKACAISGTTISEGATKYLGSGSGYAGSCFPVTDTKYLAVFNHFYATEMLAEVLSVSGTTVTSASYVQLEATNMNHSAIQRIPETNSFIVTWGDNVSGSWKICRLDIDPATGSITKGSTFSVHGTSMIANPNILMFSQNDGLVLGNNSANDSIIARYFTILDSTISFPNDLFVVFAEGSTILNQTGALVYNPQRKRFMYGAKNKNLRFFAYYPGANTVQLLKTVSVTNSSYSLHWAPSLALNDSLDQLCMAYPFVNGSNYALGFSGINV